MVEIQSNMTRDWTHELSAAQEAACVNTDMRRGNGGDSSI